MADQRFCSILHSNGTDGSTPDVTQSGVDSMKSQMDNYKGGSNWQSYGPKDHYIELNFSYSLAAGQDAYFDNFRDTLEFAANEDYITIENGDVWCCVDDGWFFGYGQESTRNPFTINVHGTNYEVYLTRALDVRGSRTMVYAYQGSTDGADPHEITAIFVIHEICHAFGASHTNGDYQVKENERFNTTPMAAAYVCNPDGEVGADTSTCYGGGDSLFNDFFCNKGMCEGTNWCNPNDCGDLCRHIERMTEGQCSEGGKCCGTKEHIIPLPNNKDHSCGNIC